MCIRGILYLLVTLQLHVNGLLFFFSVSNIIPFWVGKWAVTIVRALSLSPAQQSGFNSCAWHQSNVVDCCFLLVLILAPRTLFPYALLFLPLQILTLKIPNSTWRAAPWKGHYLSTIPIDLHHLFLPFFFFFFKYSGASSNFQTDTDRVSICFEKPSHLSWIKMYRSSTAVL